MSDFFFASSKTGGPKYRDHIHDFKASVFGYALGGVIAMIVIHTVVLSSPGGHQKWSDVASANNVAVTAPAK
jgi:hypothetical protein